MRPVHSIRCHKEGVSQQFNLSSDDVITRTMPPVTSAEFILETTIRRTTFSAQKAVESVKSTDTRADTLREASHSEDSC